METDSVTVKSRWRFQDVDMQKKVTFEVTHSMKVPKDVEQKTSLECVGQSVDVNESIM